MSDQQPQPADYLLSYYKQKLAAAQDEAAQLFAQANILQQQLEAEKKRADEAEAEPAKPATK